VISQMASFFAGEPLLVSLLLMLCSWQLVPHDADITAAAVAAAVNILHSVS
jgi:hypothetical protein